METMTQTTAVRSVACGAHVVTRYADARGFLLAVEAALLEREADNNLVLGIAERVANGQSYGLEAPLFVSVSCDGALELAGMMTPPHNLVLARAGGRAENATGVLARFLHGAGTSLPGVLAPTTLARAFSETWCGLSGARARVAMALRTHELRAVSDRRLPAGAFRRAAPVDTNLLCGWVSGFNLAVHGHDDPVATRASTVEMIDGGRLHVWECDGVPVSMAAHGRSTRAGVAVCMVFTPESLRGRGYATACVSSLSRFLLAEGRRFVMLFTDLANPVSNHVYRAIGFVPLEDYEETRFDRP